MRQVLPGLAAALILLSAVTADAQQGSVQVSAAAQAVTGDPQRVGGQNLWEPDLGVTWLQPGTRFGIFQIEVRGTRRGDQIHLGRVYAAVRDVKYGGIVWTFEGGDALFSPAMGEYRLSNLFTPAVTFTGGAVTGRTKQSSLSIVGGRTSAWRNIFGSDPEALGQSVALARVTHKPSETIEFNARASRIRTSSLEEFTYTIAASDQTGGGVRYWLAPELQVVADGSFVSYVRAGSHVRERDGSVMAGASWLHKRGWAQVNVSRFSPGDFPVLNYPLQDRQTLFAAGDYDLLRRVRVSAGWEAFKSNLEPAGSLASTSPVPKSDGTRQFGSVRFQIASRSTLTLRAEQGDRRSRPIGAGVFQDSDTGWWTAEWQIAVRRLNAFARYAERENVDRLNAPASYTQRDSSAQVFMNLSRGTQVFGTALVTRNTSALSSTTYWQAGGGAQVQLLRQDLWIRGETTFARNVDLLTQQFVPRESLSLGLNGQLTRRTTVAFNINVDRSPLPSLTGNPWMTRSILRVVRTLPTGSVYLANSATVAASVTGRGTGSVVGSVFADWNGNGVLDHGENPLEGIPLRVLGGSATSSGHDGEFSFLNVPVGLRDVGLDTGALPVDFDAPTVTSVQTEVTRGDTRRIAFGLIPLGAIDGRVIRDSNKNGKADPGEEPVDGAVVVMDDGARSEQVRKGRYRFEAVRAGDHTVTLLLESLPEGAVITGEAAVKASLGRDRLHADVGFVVSIEKRPEVRKVFPPRGGTAASRATAAAPARAAAANRPPGSTPAPRAAAPTQAPAAAAPARRPAVTPASTSRTGALYAIQIAALADLDSAREIVIRLSVSGLPAYLVEPGTGEVLYRVRVGTYGTRGEAQKAAAELERVLGAKLWVMRERP